LLELGAERESRDLSTDRLTEAELEALISQRVTKEFLNPRNELYRTQNMKEHPPPRAEAIQRMGHRAQPDSQAGGHSRLANGSGFWRRSVQQTAEMSARLGRENTKEWR
jgi:hypothetical protein